MDRSDVPLGPTLRDDAPALLAEGPLSAFRWSDDEGWTVLECTPNVTGTFGWTPEELIGRAGADFVHSDDLESLASNWERRPGGGQWFVQRYRVRCRDERWRWVEEHTRYGAKAFDGVGLLRDVDAEVRAAAAAALANERLERLLDRSPLPMLVREDGHISRINRAMRTWYGGDDVDESALLQALDASSIGDAMRTFEAEGSGASTTVEVSTLTGLNRMAQLEVSLFEQAGRRLTQGVLIDVTEARAAEERLHHLASHDPLTGLANRSQLEVRLREAIARASGSGRRVAVSFIDLDRFKVINDSLGHEVGDDVLRVVADRLRAAAREGDVIARPGGDEFVVVAADIRNRPEAIAMARRLIAIFDDPMRVAGHRLHVHGSVGVSLFPDDGDDASVLMRGADAAMYRAKKRVGSSFEMFARSDSENATSDMALELLLHECAELDAWEVFFQPIVNLREGRWVAAEALVRVPDGAGGYVDTAEAIAMAETTGVISALGRSVMRAACDAADRWSRAHLGLERVTVNVSSLEIVSSAWATAFEQDVCSRPPGSIPLEFELKESALVRAVSPITEAIAQLGDVGIQLAIDDVGAGHTSLVSLRALPVQRIKLDLRQLRASVSVDDATALARAVVALGRALDLTVVAEGIETVDDARLATELGCTEAQGYFFARPMRPGVLVRRLSSPPPIVQ